MQPSMESRNAQVFDVEVTVPDQSVDGSAPTVVLSAAPLKACVRASAPTVRHVAVGRLPGRPLGTQPPAGRQAKMWVIEEPLETAPVGAIPMPGERASAAVAMMPRETPVRGSSSAAVTIVEPRMVRAYERRDAAVISAEPRPVRAYEKRNAAVMIAAPQAVRAAVVTTVAPPAVRACEPALQYSVEREVSELTTTRAAAPRWQRKDRRSGHALVLIIGMLAGFTTVLSVVVVRQQRDLQATVEPAQRADAACAAYADQVGAVALELTRAAGDVEDVEKRIGERARSVVNDRNMQHLCGAPIEIPCSTADAACVALAVMQLRQALARR